jgi:hypothetical protein
MRILLLVFCSAATAATVALAATTASADVADIVVAVDTPPPGSNVAGPVVVRGWAADPAAFSGTGVDRVDVYLDGEQGAGGTLVGTATYGLPRPDVARNLGSPRFAPSGFALPVNLPPGPHTLHVYARSSTQPSGEGWSEATSLALLVGRVGGPPVAVGDRAGGGPTLPPLHCAGVPAPFGAYPIETPQSYGAIYPSDVPFVFGNPWFWLTYGNPGAPAYIDLVNGTVLPNAYFYQPRPARGIPLVC